MAETKVPSIPPVPSGADSAERQFLGAVKETIEVREGRRGDPLDAAVTLRRLKNMGAITLDQFGNPVFTGGSTTITVPGGGSGGGGYTPDITPPPMPSGLTATAGFAMIFVEWDSPAYTQGHGNAYTEIWAANRPAGGPDPTFGAAVFVGSTAGTGGFFSDSVPTLGVQRHYWIRHVTNDGVAGAYAGGTNGVSAATGKVGGVDLAPLIIDASKLADGAVDFGGAKVTGTITDPARFGAAVIGSAAIQNLAVQNQHVANLSADKITFGSMSGDRISVNTINADKFVANLFQTDNVLTRGLTVRDSAGNVILAAGVPLNFANVTPSSGWLNSNISISGGSLYGIGAGAGTVVDNTKITDNLVADPYYIAPAWWGASGGWASVSATANDGYAPSGQPSRFLRFSPGSADISTPFFAVEAGAAYRLKLRVYKSADAAGVFWAGLHLPNQEWFSPSPINNAGDPVGGGWNLSAIPSAWSAFEASRTVSWNQIQFRIRNMLTAGYVELHFELARVADWQTLVGGAGKPENNATYGATFGSNIYGQINSANVTTYIDGAAINLAQINVASIGTLAALSATMGAVSIDGAGGSWHYIRTGAKWWGDGANGFVIAKAGTGETLMDFKAGANRIWMSSWDDSGISFVGTANFSVRSATSGARTEMGNRAIKIYDSAGTLRVRIGDLTA